MANGVVAEDVPGDGVGSADVDETVEAEALDSPQEVYLP